MQIWIYLNGIQQGPYTLPQLQMMNLDPSTPVWYEGLPGWLPASQAPATAPMFVPAPSGSGAEGQGLAGGAGFVPAQGEIPPKPPTYLVWNIILAVLCCNVVAVAGIITGAISSSKYASGDYEGARRMSEATAWLVIIGIVWCLLALPFSILWSLL